MDLLESQKLYHKTMKQEFDRRKNNMKNNSWTPVSSGLFPDDILIASVSTVEMTDGTKIQSVYFGKILDV